MAGITFLGDVYLPRPYSSTVTFNEYVFNLEYPITTSDAPLEDMVNLKSDKSYIRDTFGSLPIAVCLANNHMLDYNREGLRDTIATLESLGIDYFGAGSPANNFNNPTVVRVGKQSVALLGYISDVLDRMDKTNEKLDEPALPIASTDHIRDDIQAAAEHADRIVVQLHWGSEEVHLPRPSDINLAHEVAAAGADLLIGHHAHATQPWEVRSNTPIFYGLGNCIMSDLDFPSYFKGGESTDRYQKTQWWWNRRSIAVDYDLGRNTTKVIPLYFDGTVLRRSRNLRCHFRSQLFALLQRGPVPYTGAHRISHAYGKTRKYSLDFIDDPWLPSHYDVKALWRIMGRDR